MNSEKLDFDQDGAEVELSAQDLLALAPPASTGAAERRSEPSTSAPINASAPISEYSSDVAPPVSTVQRVRPRTRQTRAARIVLTIGAAAVAAAAVAVIRIPKDSPTQIPFQSAIPAAPEPSAAEPAPAEDLGPPVLFKNPFDETEVFEFPPGTSKEEARAAVADLLIMRARERQEQFAAQSKKRK